jgi:zinc transporter ZupT
MERAVKGVEREAFYPSLSELKTDAASHPNVAMAIFLGLLLDGIPESLVIGASILHESAIGFSLIGGVFVSNFPEALSSAAGMREQGMATTKVIGMWGGMVLISASSAFLGAVALGEASPASFSFIEGIAAGAMLTVVAETLLPEAFHKGGGIVGISTLMGFLVASLLGAVSLE